MRSKTTYNLCYKNKIVYYRKLCTGEHFNALGIFNTFITFIGVFSSFDV